MRQCRLGNGSLLTLYRCSSESVPYSAGVGMVKFLELLMLSLPRQGARMKTKAAPKVG